MGDHRRGRPRPAGCRRVVRRPTPRGAPGCFPRAAAALGPGRRCPATSSAAWPSPCSRSPPRLPSGCPLHSSQSAAGPPGATQPHANGGRRGEARRATRATGDRDHTPGQPATQPAVLPAPCRAPHRRVGARRRRTRPARTATIPSAEPNPASNSHRSRPDRPASGTRPLASRSRAAADLAGGAVAARNRATGPRPRARRAPRLPSPEEPT
jgi:hypothetical protein